MSFYRSLLAAVAAVALISPVFADDTATTTTTTTTQTAQEGTPIADNSAAQQDQQAAPNADAAAMQAKININTASAKELMKINGINAAKARAIVAYRKKNGNFQNIEDLSKVRGFKRMNPEAMKEVQSHISIE